MKLGIIGAGLIVRTYLPQIIGLENLEIKGILNTQSGEAERLAAEYGIPLATRDFDELMAADIDTVYVAVPNHLHYEYCMRAMERGKHIIVEKPMCSTVEEANVLQKTAAEKGLFLFEAISTLYMPGFLKTREWLDRIGGLRIAEINFTQYSSRYPAFRRGEILPVFDPEKCGGALMDLNVYNVHFARGLFGMPESCRYFANVERNIDTGGMLILKYPGLTVNCMAAKDCKGLSGVVIQGTEGVIRNSLPTIRTGHITLERYDGTCEEFENGFDDNRAVPEFSTFIREIASGDRTFCYEVLQQSVDVMKIMTEARRAAGIFFPADQKTPEM